MTKLNWRVNVQSQNIQEAGSTETQIAYSQMPVEHNRCVLAYIRHLKLHKHRSNVKQKKKEEEDSTASKESWPLCTSFLKRQDHRIE